MLVTDRAYFRTPNVLAYLWLSRKPDPFRSAALIVFSMRHAKAILKAIVAVERKRSGLQDWFVVMRLLLTYIARPHHPYIESLYRLSAVWLYQKSIGCSEFQRSCFCLLCSPLSWKVHLILCTSKGNLLPVTSILCLMTLPVSLTTVMRLQFWSCLWTSGVARTLQMLGNSMGTQYANFCAKCRSI